MATILDVARLARVSKTTVSRVLNGYGPVNNETKARIENAMRQLSYTPNYFAQGMRTSRTRSIGIIIPDFGNPFYPEIFKGIEDITREKGYMSKVCSTDEDSDRELDILQQFEKRQIDGLVVFMYRKIQKNIDYLIRLSEKIPVVFMDPLVKTEPFSYVVTDGFKASQEAVRYLLAKGRDRIGYIKYPSRLMVTHERFAGYKQELENNSIPFDAGLVFEGDFHMRSGYDGAKYLMESDHPPNAIMASTDVMAIGALKYLKKAGIRIPEDVNIIGFDNIPLCTLVEPELTTIAQPIRDLGRKAAQIIFDKIADPSLGNIQLTLEGKLIVRRSTDETMPEISIFETSEETM